MAHLLDAQSQANLLSIDDIDVGGYLVHDEMNDYIDEDIEEVDINDFVDEDVKGVDIPTINSGGEGNNNVDGEDTLLPRNNNNEPIHGKLFATPDDAYTFYNCYALSKGFGTRKHGNTKSRTTGEIIRRIYVCNKEGKKRLTEKEDKEIERRRDTRSGCMARMEVAATKNGEWLVVKFNDVHNHPVVSPTKVIKFRSHSQFHRSATAKAIMSEFNHVGLRPSQITRALNVISGSQEVDITPKQCSDYLKLGRQNNVGQECYGIIKHFQEKAVIDGSYYFTMDLATDGSFRSVFWADGRSRSSYSQFGDIVIFDVTYKTNKFMLPFAPFIGVNHHRQSILFGAALLEDETEGTFVWLFEQFLKCMFDRPPVAIITDQDGAMRNAIKKVFPNTRHRFCAWHIRKHVLEHLQPFRSCYDDFSEAYNKWVNSRTIEEFEMGWETLNEKYEIKKSSWMTNMYNLRHHWVKVYLNDTFFAGMTTSGRSESIHAFFDGYVNASTMLNEFVQQYDNAVKSRRDAEEDEDFRTINSKAVLIAGHPIEEHAGAIYTRSVFELFKIEWKNSIACVDEKLSKDGFVTKYIIGSHSQDKSLWRMVEYDSSGDISITCTCAKFETEVIFCKHILYIMRKKNMLTIPKHYILHRWTIDARYKVGSVSGGIIETTTTLNENRVDPLTLWSVRAKFSQAIEDARNSPTDIQDLDSCLDSFLKNLVKRKNAHQVAVNETLDQVGSIVGISHMQDMDHISIRDPVASVKTKRRPKIASRVKSGLELAADAKKQRTCGLCGGKGHYRTGCHKRKLSDGQGDASLPEHEELLQ